MYTKVYVGMCKYYNYKYVSIRTVCWYAGAEIHTCTYLNVYADMHICIVNTIIIHIATYTYVCIPTYVCVHI